MNLVTRYVQAVKNELPKHNREDIAKELQSTLEDELESLTEKAPLNATEVAAFLERRGHPVQVASQYWPRRSLVGEHVYPIYKQALVLICSAYFALSVLLNFEDFQVTRDWASVGKLPNLFFDLFSTMFLAALILTVVFHFFGDEIAQQKWLWKFNARNLPDVDSQAAYIPRTETISYILGTLLGLTLLTFGTVTFRNIELRADLSPIANWLEALRYLLLADLGLNLLHLAQPFWTRAKLWLRTALGVGMVLCLVIMLSIPSVVIISGGRVTDPSLTTSLNWTVKITIAVFIGITAWSTFETLRRVLRLRLPMA
jgi:hypothetical protein